MRFLTFHISHSCLAALSLDTGIEKTGKERYYNRKDVAPFAFSERKTKEKSMKADRKVMPAGRHAKQSKGDRTSMLQATSTFLKLRQF